MSPSHTQLTAASDEEMPDMTPMTPTTRTSRLRGFGLAVTVVGLVCMVGANWPRAKHEPLLQRFEQVRDVIVRVVEDHCSGNGIYTTLNPSFTTDMDLQFGQDGAEEPSAMEISAKIHKDDDPRRDFQLAVTFLAEEGMGNDLQQRLQAISDASIDLMEDLHRNHYNGNYYGDANYQKQMKQKFTYAQDGDEVTVNFVHGLDDDAKHQREIMSEEFHQRTPEISASLNFGRDLETMYADKEENVVEVWHGLHFKSSTNFKGLLLQILQHAIGRPYGKAALALKSIVGKVDVRYKDADELGDLFDDLPKTGEVFDMVIKGIQDMPPTLQESIFALRGSMQGIKNIELRGLPASLKITVTPTNFKLSTLLVPVLDETIAKTV